MLKHPVCKAHLRPFAWAGVTGSRVSMESRVEGLISMLHEVTDKSVAVGFGISAPDAVCFSKLYLPFS